MSGPHDHVMEMTPLDQFDPNYAVYDSQFTGLQRTSDPSTPYEGFGFWYRPENQENIYNSDASFSQQSRPIPPPAMDMPLALKHKRTRSGCFTCRQRRVKVCKSAHIGILFLTLVYSATKPNPFATVSMQQNVCRLC